MQSTLFDLLTEDRQSLSSGKTSPASYPSMTTPSGASSALWRDLAPQSHLETEAGHTQVWYMDPAAQSPGAPWMPNISEWPNDAAVCSLSQVLEPSVPRRFYLSQKACAGILRRAEKRGKELPRQLTQALAACRDAPTRTPITGTQRLSSAGTTRGGAIDVATSLNANRGCHNPGDFEAGALCVTGDVTNALKAEGADASEDGTGRGTPIIAFSGKDYGADAGEVSPPLRAMGHDGSHQNGGGQVAVAFHPTQDPISSTNGTTHAMGTGSKQGVATIAISQGLAVRRLTPRECERLQGWPDDHTLVPYRGKPMADGPRYKIIGNGWALPCVQWIGRRMVAAMGGHK